MNICFSNIIVVSMAVCVAFISSVSCAETNNDITILNFEDAKLLAMVSQKSFEKVTILEPMDDKDDPEFYMFEVISVAPGTDFIQGHIGVNKVTGQVWYTAGRCREIKTAALENIRTKTLRKNGMSMVGRWKFLLMRPICDADPL